ncbi:MAG: tRNA preQ1(34) S-adenosylmethionine ribosyltransferase-isomerase QueA [Thermoguttaceae bacterium]|nr:tRNA preQ1(34) S-adenosylmethionine ribosyltransferase-isomerase QueA [Thermoguttaceae bacterium]MBQ8363635.1 tRNA preQ1(34) S-adenosylmethionine ribosyltransferase-isomerase QueA [Thermoguttaceae bacterium]MBQ9128928.1 tRNA preQ1(34) S-adenosylmethionine ribosyltransferase-isomerase QueA [Thermoguttaceae bacterium]
MTSPDKPLDAAFSELDAYDYELPERLIAQTPRPDRASARMLVVDRATGSFRHRRVRDLPEYLRPDDVLVLNDAKVLPARLIGRRAETQGRWEGLFLQFDPRGFWEIMSKTRGKLRPGEKIELENPDGSGLTRYLEVVGRTDAKTMIVKPLTREGEDSADFLDKVGWVPIPPYIRGGRMTPSDRDNYQTVYASNPGAVAAPTAGLHFTKELLDEIRSIGVAVCPTTLYVGAGTFKPITADRLADHQMHSEVANLSEATVRTIEERKARGGRVFAIGTTSVRTLESAANALPDGSIDSTGLNPNKLAPFSGPTNLFIRPPYRFKVVDAMLTNFHLPKSTLVILVRTFGGDDLLKRAYETAIAEDYRFYSYGDAMLIV